MAAFSKLRSTSGSARRVKYPAKRIATLKLRLPTLANNASDACTARGCVKAVENDAVELEVEEEEECKDDGAVARGVSVRISAGPKTTGRPANVEACARFSSCNKVLREGSGSREMRARLLVEECMGACDTSKEFFTSAQQESAEAAPLSSRCDVSRNHTITGWTTPTRCEYWIVG